ncbi:hypothetical protein MNBD_NITROSPINAE03-1546 [hydrothermal vent metagenome]|uniref:Uncharacterized protein n=1 Tax=hydrothermal vent metagenome TaxID=652676 RepID=A0A3B1CA52_9ZZZZ
MTANTEQKIESSKKKLESLKSSIGESAPGPQERAKLRKAVKGLKRAQRRDKVGKTYKSKLESQEANRLKNIQKSEEKAAKKKAAEETALNAVAQEQAEQAAATEDKAATEDSAPKDKEADQAS